MERLLTQEEILQLKNKSDSELRYFWDDDFDVDRPYETRMLERESSSDKSDEETWKYLQWKNNFGLSFPFKSLESINFIVLVAANSSFQCNQNGILNKIPSKNKKKESPKI
ncbi:hypothetical protein TNCV_118471 [Trichonephila clavipes]|nr:hypothetical protein TNCV_118471 [Trichonephila clavipes]